MKKLTVPILLVGVPEEHPDLAYVSGFSAPDPVVFLITEKRRYLVVSALEVTRATRVIADAKPKVPTEVVTPDMLGLKSAARRRISQWALGVARYAGVARVRIPPDFPYGIGMAMRKGGIQLNVAKDALFPERAVKTQNEVRMIRESQQAAVIAMRKAIGMITDAGIDNRGRLVYDRHQLTSEWIQRRIREILLAHDTFCRDVIVAGGAQAADPHEGGHGPLYAGQAIVIDIFPRHLRHGYWGDLTRTVVKGKASPKLRHMYQAVRAAQARALDMIRPRVKCATIHRAVCDEFKARGYATAIVEGKPQGFIHSTGHGVGLAIHESPSLAPVDTSLRSGHVITVEPGLYYADIGGIRVEDTVVVTSHGCRQLVPCEKRFEV